MNDSVTPPSGLGAWWLAIRPRTLTVAVVPVLVGHALAWAQAGALDYDLKRRAHQLHRLVRAVRGIMPGATREPPSR